MADQPVKWNEEEKLSGSLQENLLCLLCYDQKHARIVRAALTVQMFESSVSREVAAVAMDFIDQYREPVGDHLAEHLDRVLKGEDRRKAGSYQRLLDELSKARHRVNSDYTVAQLNKFARRQNLKTAVIMATEALEDGRIDDTEVVLHKALASRAVTFEAGTDMSKPEQALRFLDHEEQPMLTGIEALDRFSVGPAPRTLFLISGPLGKGKSWALMHLGKYAMLQRKSVLHVTLEMSEEKVSQRYNQMFFSITRRPGPVRVPRMVKNDDGSLRTIDFEDLGRLLSMEDPDIRKKLTQRIERRMLRRPRLQVKKFPSGTLTTQGLNAYLDGMERFENFVPELIVIDYAELMKLDPKDRRGSTGQLFVDLRGIADERNCALVTASQVNRVGIGKVQADESDLSEDISKAFTADTLVTYNQTKAENRMGLARLYVAKNRDGEGGMVALITQAYAMGQFCLDSVVMTEKYSAYSAGNDGGRDDEDDDGQGPERRSRRP